MQELVFSNATLEDLLKVVLPICKKILKEERSDILCPGVLESYLPVVSLRHTQHSCIIFRTLLITAII